MITAIGQAFALVIVVLFGVKIYDSAHAPQGYDRGYPFWIHCGFSFSVALFWFLGEISS